MPGMLARSRSLRFLKNTRKDAQHQEDDLPMQPQKASQTDFDKFRSATPVLRAESSLSPPNLEVRPNTSGGPGDRSTIMFHMKTDPTLTFQSSEHVPFYSSPMHSTTTLSTTGIAEEQGIIGIALGSPTVGSNWNSTPQTSNFATTSDEGMNQMQTHIYSNSGDRQSGQKSKLSRWKSLFRKAAPPTPQHATQKPSFYQLAQTVTNMAPRADSHHDDESIIQDDRSKHMMEAMRGVSPPTYRPDIRASRKGAPDGYVVPQSPEETPATRTRALTLGDLTANARPSAKIQRAFTTANHSSAATNARVSNSTSLPLLDVNIPDVKMDRYSVMFGNVLQSGTDRSSSLLVRRQVNAERLKPLTDLAAKENEQESPMDYRLQRRATSPHAPTASPRLSLFPSTTSSRAPSPLSLHNNRRKMVHRSRTAPAKSPLRQTFQTTGTTSTQSPSATLKPGASAHLKPAITPVSACSFESDSESVGIVVAQATPFKIQLDDREPEWEMCPKPLPATETKNPSNEPSPDLSRSGSQRQPRVTKLSALSSHPSSAPLDAPSPLQRIQSLRSPPLSARRAGEKRTASESRGKGGDKEATATVGVARSISVSRANSPRAVKRPMTDIGNVTSPERLVERQALTPTMVEVRNRKSQKVQVEMMV